VRGRQIRRERDRREWKEIKKGGRDMINDNKILNIKVMK